MKSYFGDIWNQKWFQRGLWYSLLCSFGTLHGHLFNTYHLDMFVSVWKISSKQVGSVHLIYMIWNTLNDVFSGYIGDWYQYKYGTRLPLILPMNILWCFVTLLAFYSPFNINVTWHYFITISLYDAFYSFVNIIRGALWTDDLTNNQSQRVKLQLVSIPINSIIGMILMRVSYLYWDKSNLDKFRQLLWYCIGISIAFSYISIYKLKQLINESHGVFCIRSLYMDGNELYYVY